MYSMTANFLLQVPNGIKAKAPLDLQFDTGQPFATRLQSLSCSCFSRVKSRNCYEAVLSNACQRR